MKKYIFALFVLLFSGFAFAQGGRGYYWLPTGSGNAVCTTLDVVCSEIDAHFTKGAKLSNWVSFSWHRKNVMNLGILVIVLAS